jgi:very-short-patch-repair endonuclease
MSLPTRHPAEDRLRRLLRSNALHPHRFSTQCEIGPFVVAHVCAERSLIVELQVHAEQRQRQQQRATFLAGLGYAVLQISPLELERHPRRVLGRVRAALQSARH